VAGTSNSEQGTDVKKISKSYPDNIEKNYGLAPLSRFTFRTVNLFRNESEEFFTSIRKLFGSVAEFFFIVPTFR
jgi:hypothetical protein